MKSKFLGIILLLFSIILAIAINEYITYYRNNSIHKIREKYTDSNKIDLTETLRPKQTQFYNNRQ